MSIVHVEMLVINKRVEKKHRRRRRSRASECHQFQEIIGLVELVNITEDALDQRETSLGGVRLDLATYERLLKALTFRYGGRGAPDCRAHRFAVSLVQCLLVHVPGDVLARGSLRRRHHGSLEKVIGELERAK